MDYITVMEMVGGWEAKDPRVNNQPLMDGIDSFLRFRYGKADYMDWATVDPVSTPGKYQVTTHLFEREKGSGGFSLLYRASCVIPVELLPVVESELERQIISLNGRIKDYGWGPEVGADYLLSPDDDTECK
jgi:hypothetical protein